MERDSKNAKKSSSTSRMDDLEAALPSTTSSPTTSYGVIRPDNLHRRDVSDITFTDQQAASPSPVYTVTEVIGDDQVALAEDDMIRNLEHQERDEKHILSQRGSSRIFLPDLPEETEHAFTDLQKPESSSQNDRRIHNDDENISGGLRSLTAQLVAAKDAVPGSNSKPGGVGVGQGTGLDGATQGTAADRMANKAATIFSSVGTMPEGVKVSEEKNLDGKAAQIKGDLQKKAKAAREGIVDNTELLVDYFRPQKKFILHFWWIRIKYIVIPAVSIAAILFYFFDNPPHGKLKKNDNGDYVNDFGQVPDTATISWWFLFVARQMVLQSFAIMWEMFIIDFLAMKTRILRHIVGPYFSLWIAQSKGWPFQAIAWGLSDLVFLQGKGRFAHHWLFFQGFMDLFNGSNASGNVTSNSLYRQIILCAIGFGSATVVKRVILSNVIGKRLVCNYGEQLEATMKNVLLVTEIAKLSKKVARDGHNKKRIEEQLDIDSNEGDGSTEDPGNKSLFGSFKFTSSDQSQLYESLLGEWEEPIIPQQKNKEDHVTVASLLHFRRALAFIDAEYPFSVSFGSAQTREKCIRSSQQVFDRLATGESGLRFNALAPLVLNDNGKLNRSKMKQLCKLLHPSSEGTLTKLEFVKSMDAVYKKLRTLTASIETSSQIEQNYETIVNVIHYGVLVAVGLAVVGTDIQGLFVSFGALFVGIGFIIGGACASFLEGLLMIFVRRPYEIGDRIAIQDVTQIGAAEGASGWIVEKIDLYSTTIRFATTREVATVTNGELSRTRIVNLQRSDQANVYLNLKFGINVTNSQIVKLKEEIQTYVADRPREWKCLHGIRMTSIESDAGYVAYIVVLQHRESWQNVGTILNSKSNIASFVFDLTKALGIGYNAPSLPVELSIQDNPNTSNDIISPSEKLSQLLESKKSK